MNNDRQISGLPTCFENYNTTPFLHCNDGFDELAAADARQKNNLNPVSRPVLLSAVIGALGHWAIGPLGHWASGAQDVRERGKSDGQVLDRQTYWVTPVDSSGRGASDSGKWGNISWLGI